ncbi:MAG TPA: YceI family protein [Solirubrobacterales bacterium]|jgi:polyisoprenoid-binding protein YceI|nr:YceI family protein [Solirubrobacterales bacterium]
MSTETVNQQIPAGTFKVDPVHSGLHFAITHNGIATFRSTFGEYSATLTGGENPKLEGSVEVASIDIDEEMLKGHLLSPDFFDAEQYPQLKFSTTELSVEDDGTARLSGQLELHGETREVQATGRFAALGADLGGSERVGFSFETALDRRDFGLNWNAELPSGGDVLEWEVAINVELELVAEAS